MNRFVFVIILMTSAFLVDLWVVRVGTARTASFFFLFHYPVVYFLWPSYLLTAVFAAVKVDLAKRIFLFQAVIQLFSIAVFIIFTFGVVPHNAILLKLVNAVLFVVVVFYIKPKKRVVSQK
ncbi:hypothetical protein [Acanthopleuribacter pedis]|uniref:Uncharacterized protein n=1 Tax=Acanthopleuribacter pedis TaxID=442870 RepID=A0A8J7QGY6_9BACT|nr:hypothetical protein [Acanthopleuribacter pedis]MBO1320156.1 hypothetical protein [Acanthopleuribacter pedis]